MSVKDYQKLPQKNSKWLLGAWKILVYLGRAWERRSPAHVFHRTGPWATRGRLPTVGRGLPAGGCPPWAGQGLCRKMSEFPLHGGVRILGKSD